MKRLTVLLLVLAILVSALTACAPEAEQPAATEATFPETQQPDAQTPVLDAGVVLTEAMPDNRNLVLGHSFDWVELYNPDEVGGSLQGYYLTDDPSRPEAMPLADYTIDEGSYLTVVLDDSAPIQLSEVGETVYLYREGTILSQLTFGPAQNGESFGEAGACAYPTPGYANTQDGYQAYLEALVLPELVISEVVADNTAYATDGMYYDYVEVENRSDKPVDLHQYYLTDSWENTNRYFFPQVTLEPGEFYLVFCSGSGALGENHAPFEISRTGETLYLARQGVFTDALTVPADLKSNESFGRQGNLPVYLQATTPGAKNTEGYLNGVAMPEVNVAPGQYEQTVQLELTGEGTIYYTLDGARPTTASAVYSGPIDITGVTTVRAMCVNGERSSAIGNYTYAVGVSHDLPILVIAIPELSRSLLMMNIESSREYEAVMTLIEDGEVKFSVPFGMRLHGNDSRKGAKKNFQLRFRGEYGAGRLEYRLFEDRDIDEYDSLLLKGGSEDYINAMVRDELATSIANGTSALYTQARKSVVLYLGGDYWGIHYLRERFSDAYVASHLDVSEESVDIIFSTGGYVQVGSASSYSALKNYVLAHDMSTPENYAYLAERIDVTSLIDWYVFRTYLDDRDLANIRRFRSDEADGKWRWMFFDMDWGFYQQSSFPVSDIINDPNGDPLMIRAVLASEAGQDAFLKRYAYLMETVLNEAYINQCLDDLLEEIGSEMARDRERWNKSYSSWEIHIQLIRDFAEDDKRVSLVLNDLRIYFQLSDAEMEYYFGNLDWN